MKRKSLIPIVFLVSFVACSIISTAGAVTQEEANAAGAGFHEPSDDWWDSEYKYRIPMNITIENDMDLELIKATVDFSDYMSEGDGIVDLASMQVVRMWENESSIPVDFYAGTDAVDIWNPPTVPEIEGALIEAILEENGTFIGTVFNGFEETGLMNQSIRFQANLSEPTDEVTFQFVYQPDFEKNVTENDYLEIYAGVPGDWSSPIRIYRRDLPDEKAWSDYYTIELESTMQDLIWINIDAPSLRNEDWERYFSIDFVFVDGKGFDGRKVRHFVPELLGINDIEQEVYYPKVQVLQHERPPMCEIYTIGGFENATYFLYYNLANESNHRVIENDAVPFVGELDTPQTFVTFNNPFGNIIIDTNRVGTEGNMTIGTSFTDTWGTFLDFGIKRTDTGYAFKKYFNSIFTTVIIQNSTTKATYTVYKDKNFMDVKVETTIPLKAECNITMLTSTSPLTWIANETDANEISEEISGQSTSRYISLFNNDFLTYLMVSSNETMTYDLSWLSAYPDNATVNITVDDDMKFKVEILNSSETYDSNNDVINDESDALYELYSNRQTESIDGNVSTENEQFADLEIFLVSAAPFLNIAYVGNNIKIALFGHNLQSMSVNVDNRTGEVGFNGTWSIDVSALGRGLLDRDHEIRFTGRNEFGDTVELVLNWWIADNVLDGVWTGILALFSNAFTYIAGLIGVLVPTAFVKNRKMIKKRKCTGDNCNIK